jgi:hypothetical protein
VPLLAAHLGTLPNRLSVEGNRSNAARKLILQFGVLTRWRNVRGYADQKLLKRRCRRASNRRVSIVVKYRTPDEPALSARRPRGLRKNSGPAFVSWRNPTCLIKLNLSPVTS